MVNVGSARLPRRSTDGYDCAPVVLDRAGDGPGSAVIIPGEPEQAAVMRDRIRALVPWRPSEVAPLLSLASELFNNALTHSRSGDSDGEVIVAVIKRGGCVQVKVTDQGPRNGMGLTPYVRPMTPEIEGGFGLNMVAAEATRWGTLHDSDGRTTVWVEIERHAGR